MVRGKARRKKNKKKNLLDKLGLGSSDKKKSGKKSDDGPSPAQKIKDSFKMDKINEKVEELKDKANEAKESFKVGVAKQYHNFKELAQIIDSREYYNDISELMDDLDKLRPDYGRTKVPKNREKQLNSEELKQEDGEFDFDLNDQSNIATLSRDDEKIS